MTRGIVAALAGLMFAIGLGLSGMTQPTKVIGFLDVFGHWDPSLAFVMIGAIAVHMPFLRYAHTLETPWLAPVFSLPSVRGIDRRLLGGAALFGLGWGAAGFCPGPAIVSVAALSPATLAFVAAMVTGMVMYQLAFERPAVATPTAHQPARRAA